MNGQITEVKQSGPRIILRWVIIQDPFILSFFNLAMIAEILGKLVKSHINTFYMLAILV